MDIDSGCVGVGRSGVHRWCYLRARGPSCNQDIIRVMKQLQPLLQDAIQKRCGAKLWEAPTISGPLTWRQFHRLAGRGKTKFVNYGCRIIFKYYLVLLE